MTTLAKECPCLGLHANATTDIDGREDFSVSIRCVDNDLSIENVSFALSLRDMS